MRSSWHARVQEYHFLVNYVKHTQNKKQITDRPLEKRLAIIQWYTEQEEVHDLYYYAIRLGIENQAHKLGYEITRIFHNDPLEKATQVVYILVKARMSFFKNGKRDRFILLNFK